MISQEQAIDHTAKLSLGRLRELTRQRLRGQDVTPVGSGYAAEPSEDLIIQLLKVSDLPPERRAAIIAGCKDVYKRLFAWLISPEEADKEATALGEVTIRLSRVVDVAAPDELRRQTDSLLRLCSDPAVASDVRAAAVRAAMSFQQTADHAPLWEELLESPDVAAYAFSALLNIDPHAPRIERTLRKLWQRQFEENWPVDTPFLARRAARARGSEDV